MINPVWSFQTTPKTQRFQANLWVVRIKTMMSRHVGMRLHTSCDGSACGGELNCYLNFGRVGKVGKGDGRKVGKGDKSAL